MNKDIIILIKAEQTKNNFDELVQEFTEQREVFAKVESVGYKEFYEASAVGMKPTLKFILSDYFDYDGEKIIKYQDEYYAVIRTYKHESRNELEITVTAGINAESVFN